MSLNGRVPAAEAGAGSSTVAWSNVTGKPSAFTPSDHAASHAAGADDELTPTAIGLGNVDNTSDADKPVSTAQAAADTTAKARANHTGAEPLPLLLGDFARISEVESGGKRGIAIEIKNADDVNFDVVQQFLNDDA